MNKVNTKMFWATLVAVTILPLIYGALYLYAFWDPYAKIENVPVAIVNLDVGSSGNNLGNDLVENLKENRSMNWQFVDLNYAEKGLLNKQYYAMAVIPKDFTNIIKSVDGSNPKKAEIEFKSRPTSSFMAAKFADTAMFKIKANLNEKITEKYFENIFDSTRDSAKDLGKAVDGSVKLEDGLEKAITGGDDLFKGTDKLNSGIYDLKNGLGELSSGAERLNNGANQLNVGVSSVSSGISNVDNGLTLIIGSLNSYFASHPEATMSAELRTALGAANQVSVGTKQLVVGSKSLMVGANDLATGSASLRENLYKAKNGSDELLVGIEKIKNGQTELNNGLNKALDGITELKNKLAEATKKAEEKTDFEKNQKQQKVMSGPVTIKDISIDLVANNGTGFAPYFIPLSLWVGAMAIFFLIDFEEKNKFKTKFGFGLLVGLVQNLVLGIVLRKLIGLEVNDVFKYYLLGTILSWTYFLIQLWLNLKLKMAGKFVAIIILMLQLTGSAGSYPLETLPSFFQKINPWLPMTYAVSAYREIISGNQSWVVVKDLRMLVIMSVVMFSLISFRKVYEYRKK
ncbi:MAG TPA: YhgE/Pip domain-containing protein [Candidatus Woesebacteria bacterium]|nr:YhgE/Pip domain-containing protein [Candidatus Woesebacteria bacterium]